MTKRRDTYKARVYRAENVLPRSPGLEGIRGAQEYVDKLLRSAWWKKRFPGVTALTVHPSNRTFAHTVYADREIYLPRAAQNLVILSHELAHIGTDFFEEQEKPKMGWPDHGEEFIVTLLAMIHHTLGFDRANALKAALDREKIPWREAMKSARVFP